MRFLEKAAEYLFFCCALVSVAAVAAVCAFLLANGLPAIAETGFCDFLLGRRWKPTSGLFGIMPMIAGSLCVTAGAALLGLPLGILTAAFMAHFCPAQLYGPLSSAVRLMAGIPSVIYGFFGLTVIAPIVRGVFARYEADGESMLSAVIILSLMMLPTVVSVAETAIKAVPESCRQGALALGATEERSVFFAVLPAARSGLAAAAALGIGRAAGETMAVMMVAGNQARMPVGIFSGVRTLTANIAMEIGYAAGLHRGALVATAIILFLFIMLINFSAKLLSGRITGEQSHEERL